MIHAKPFRALLPRKEDLEHFVVPPYDVLTEQDVKEYQQKCPNSFLQVTRCEGGAEESKGHLLSMVKEGQLHLEEEQDYYIYEEEWARGKQRGIVYIAEGKDYEQGKIKKHELTLPEKEKDRTEHFLTLQTQTEPVFFFTPQITIPSTWLGEALYEVKVEEVIHRLWRVDRTVHGEVEQFFSQLEAVYIADGHHRSASAAQVAREMESGILAVLFPGKELVIEPYHRFICSLPLPGDKIVAKLKKDFDVVERDYTGEVLCHGEYALLFREKSYRLKIKQGESQSVERLDAEIVQNRILEPVFDIVNPREDNNLDFGGGELTQKKCRQLLEEYEAIILMPAATIEDIVAVADAGEIMPPKSTWFVPKLISGLFLYPYCPSNWEKQR